MTVTRDRKSENNMFLVLIGVIITGLVYQYRLGISGNDFWWHLKTGEWIVANNTVPKTGIFSWYATENGIRWVSHEWLSEILLYLIHNSFGDSGIFFLSMFAALGMALIILIRNKDGIVTNIILSVLYILPMLLLFPIIFYGRPQLISNFLFYLTLLCLYRNLNDRDSKAILALPVISIAWANIHGGSSNLPYILCLLFLLSGLFEFSFGKLYAEKLSDRQIKAYFVIFVLSILAISFNPHGMQMILYPYVNIGDSFLQQFIAEWRSPDAKDVFDLLYFLYPLIFVYIIIIVTNKRIKLIDLTLCVFFTYASLRSIRFVGLFYIASTFFVFDYFISRIIKPIEKKQDLLAFYMILFVFMSINIYSGLKMADTIDNKKIISKALDDKFIALVKRESPQRLYNDYNFGETLIYNNIETFVDARADIFAAHNLHDAVNLLYLRQTDDKEKDQTIDAGKIIDEYDFDALLIESNRGLAIYLKSHPETYSVVYEDDNAVYFKRIDKKTILENRK